MKNNLPTYLRQFLLRFSAMLALMPCLLASAQQPSSGPTNTAPPVFGDLRPGPHPVGYRIIHLKDTTRLVRPKRDYFGTVDTTDRARQINLYVWYPAVAVSDAPMTFEQYIYHSDFGALNEATRREQRDFARRFLFAGRFSDEVWQRLINSPMLARRNAREAAGKFPLVLGELRPLSNSITNEYLASHGYVVVMVEGARLPNDISSALSKEDSYRNLEFAYAHTRTMPNVDQNITGTLGFSAFGVTQIIYAMRTREVDAVVCLESGFFHNKSLYESTKGTPGYEVTALRAPLLHMFRLGKEHPASLDDFGAMRYSTRYHYQVEAPQIRHADFSTEGMAEVTVLGLRQTSAPQLRKAFELTNLYVLNFLNAYLKGDAAGLAFLRRDPVANGALEKMVSITEKPGMKAAPSEAEFLRFTETQSLERALALFKEAKKNDPDAELFRETALNQIGNQLMRMQRPKESIEIFKLSWEAYPKSSQTAYNLGEAYAVTGNKQLAVEFLERSLQLVEGDSNLTDNGRQAIRNGAPEKIKALKAAQNN